MSLNRGSITRDFFFFFQMKRLMLLFVTLTTLCILPLRAENKEVRKFDFKESTPDTLGIIRSEQLELEPFEDVIFYASSLWPGDGNRLTARNGAAGDLTDGYDGGVMLLLKNQSKQYTCILAGVNNDLYSWFSTKDGKSFYLQTGTFGKGKYSGKNKILYTKASDSSAYVAIRKAWELHRDSPYNTTTFRFREEKEYPEYFNYLGWCSWESFKTGISEEKLINVMEKIEGGETPIRYILVDDGHQQVHLGDPWSYNALMQFGPIEKKFPHGYGALLKHRKENKIKWMGLWLAMLGGRDGIHPENNLDKDIQKSLKVTKMNTLVPNGSKESAELFYDRYIDYHITQPGWDFTKVDFQSWGFVHYAGTDEAMTPILNNKNAFSNPFLFASNLTKALERRLKLDHKGVINCNAQAAYTLFNLSNSSVARCSDDYWVHDLGKAQHNLHNSFASMPLLGTVVWGDHDMFHSSDTISNKMMAISKAISGGPIYLSDRPAHFDKEVVAPLSFSDGKLLRPLAPAVPTEESLFTNPQMQKSAYITFAPLKNKSVAVAAYNLYSELYFDNDFFGKLRERGISESVIEVLKEKAGHRFRSDEELWIYLRSVSKAIDRKVLRKVQSILFANAKRTTVNASITPQIYAHAPSMMQDESREWEIPSEGILCYDWAEKKGTKLKDAYPFSIEGFGDKFFILVPIYKGWGIVGDGTKYNTAVAYDLVSLSRRELEVEMYEGGGKLILWNSSAKALTSNVKAQQIGDNLWSLTVPKGTKRIKISAIQ